MLFGYNELASKLLDVLEVDYETIDRFRDCFLNSDGSEIVIYTRTGGNNRVDHEESNDRLRKIKGFIGDEDDSFDNTYALFRYSVPEDMQKLCKASAVVFGVDVVNRWKDALTALKG
jgi:hypothetical protein